MTPADMGAIYRCPVDHEPERRDETYGRVFADVYDDWYQKVTNVDETVDTLARLAPAAVALARAEGLGAHARSISVRLAKRR